MAFYRESPIVQAMEIPDEDDLVGWRQLARWMQRNGIPFKFDTDYDMDGGIVVDRFAVYDQTARWRRVAVTDHLVLRGDGLVQIYRATMFDLIFVEVAPPEPVIP